MNENKPITTDLGAVTAYAAAVEKGYTGTRDDFGQLLANFAGSAQQVAEDRVAVENAKKSVDQTVEQFDAHSARVTQEAIDAIQTVGDSTKAEGVAAVQNAQRVGVESVENAKESGTKEVQAVREAGVADINKAREGGVSAISAAQKTAEDSIESAKANSVTAIKAAETEGVKAVNAAVDAGKENFVTDDTLTLPGRAADAEATGREIKRLESGIDEKILEAFFGSMRNGKVYQTELYLTETNPTSDGVKTLANEGKVCEPSTDTVEGRDDYEEIGIFKWFNCNYVADEHGRKIPTAVEGWGNGFKNDGSVDVGVIALTPYWNVEEKDGKQIWTLSDTPNDKYGLVGWETAKKEDGSFAPYVVHSKYVSGIGTDGLLRSFKNSKPARNQSYSNMIANYQKKGEEYWGGGKERTLYKILYQVIKYATKNEQAIFSGTSSYNFQYVASVQRSTKETYFPITNAQAGNIVVGAYVSVGYGSADESNVNNDRGVATMHKYADDVKVLRIEDLDESNKAVYLDVTEGFTTEPVAISNMQNAPIIMSSMHWWSGSTDQVIGKHDGSLGSNTDGKHPHRIMGIEDAVGGYIVYADSAMMFKEDYSKDVYVARRGTKHTTSENTIKSAYKLIGNIPGNDGVDFWIGDIGVDVETCTWFAKNAGRSSQQGWGDRCYAGGKTTPSARADLGRGNLWNESNAGSVCVNCWLGLGGTSWYSLGCD